MSSFGHPKIGFESLLLIDVGAGHEHWSGAVVEKFAHNQHALFGALAWSVDGFRSTLAQVAVVIDQRVAYIAEWEALQTLDGFIGRWIPKKLPRSIGAGFQHPHNHPAT